MSDNSWLRSYNDRGIVTGGAIQGGTVTATSDVSLKQDIVSLDGALDLVSRIQARRFRWRADGRADLGVVAQELETVLPELVFDGADGNKTVNYGALSVVNTAAIQALMERMDAQDRRIAELERRAH